MILVYLICVALFSLYFGIAITAHSIAGALYKLACWVIFGWTLFLLLVHVMQTVDIGAMRWF